MEQIIKLRTDITSGTLNVAKLCEELQTSIGKVQLVSHYNSPNSPEYDDQLNEEIRIFVGTALTAPETATLNTIVADHAEFSLVENKIIRYQKIDQKTGELIASGFTYDSQVFSLSSNAQTNWHALKNQKTSFTFPKDVTTINSDIYSLAEINVDALWNAGKIELEGHLDSGRILKKSIFDAVDQAAVDLIIDTR